ncbi:uncharacterized protein LOC122256324 isoform X2 [Penaeus japonicus]|uniref:uncharacterized protein LOC122256324 isoform X2 n=1 Tax=Penaeus japonicus TaxID=27405 RepID=UPI001C70F974|nr:uncharacterized protein LOC122256324 isoform X2 [Penaeus japonicus]
MTLAILLSVSALQLVASQSIQVPPSFSGGSPTFPHYASQYGKDLLGAETSSSQQVVKAVPAPNQIRKSGLGFGSLSDVYQPLNYDENDSTLDASQYDLYPDPPEENASRQNYGAPNLGIPKGGSRNQSARFFTLNTSRQTLDLGLSFTVPFLSIPMTSLASMSSDLTSSTSSALNSLLAINWPSVLAVGGAVLLATLLLPQLMTFLASFTSALRLGGAGVGAGSGFKGHDTEPVFGYDAASSYARNLETGDSLLPVAPFTSILNQLDDALAQYDLDSTSCLQRAVCSYVANSDASVREGDAGAAQMIVAGLARSQWLELLAGHSSFTQAVQMGRSGGNCQLQYPKCPFSLGGVLRFLSTYATLTS